MLKFLEVSDTAESMSMFISMYMELYALPCLREKNVVSAFWADVGGVLIVDVYVATLYRKASRFDVFYLCRRGGLEGGVVYGTDGSVTRALDGINTVSSANVAIIDPGVVGAGILKV